MINILLITTTIYGEETELNLTRLFNSIKVSNNFSIKHVVLFQGVTAKPTFKLPDYVEAQFIPKVVSLSKARNIMLESEMKNIEKYDLVAFPDDDCWYPMNNFEDLINLFYSEKLDYLVTKYRFSEHDEVPSSILKIRKKSVFKFFEFSSSITIFVTGKIFKEIGCFDERLGVGAKFVGGEDLDYSINAYYRSKNRSFLDLYLMAHKDRNITNKLKYYEGSLFVFAKNFHHSSVIRSLLLRKLAVGIYYVCKKRMNLIDYFSIIKKVFKC